MPDEEAQAQAYGTTVERIRRQNAIHQLRDAGYRGTSFEDLARQAYRDDVAQSYRRAEDATNGYLVTRQGMARRPPIDPRTLFSGPEASARRWASDELKEWWDRNGRLTYDQFVEQLLTGGAGGRSGRGADSDFLR